LPNSPLERGAALAAGCVISLKLLFLCFFIIFGDFFIDFRLKHPPALSCHPSQEGIFWLLRNNFPFHVTSKWLAEKLKNRHKKL